MWAGGRVWGWGGNKREMFSMRMPLKSGGCRSIGPCAALPVPRAQAVCGEQRALLSWQRGETGNEEEKEKKPDPGVELKKKNNQH